MKKLCVFYGNCQSDGIVHFLKKTRMAADYDFSVWHNWQVLMGEQDVEGLYRDMDLANVFVYQPCNGYQRTNGSMVAGTDDLMREHLHQGRGGERVRRISFAYQFNHGFFPLLNVAPGPDGWITAALLKQKPWSSLKGVTGDIARHELMKDYNSGRLRFDCARRLIECLAEQSRREETTDIKMVPFILHSYRKHRLFLTQNHLTSPFFARIAWEVMAKVYGERDDDDLIAMRTVDENEVGMNGVMPVHPAVVDELGLEYPATDGAHEYYRDLLEKMIGGK